MNREGAVCGMLAGLIFTLTYIIYFKFIHPELNSSEYWFLGISPEGIGFIGMIVNVVTSSLVTSLTPKPPEHIGAMIENLRRP